MASATGIITATVSLAAPSISSDSIIKTNHTLTAIIKRRGSITADPRQVFAAIAPSDTATHIHAKNIITTTKTAA
jgi:hypothetical protein